MAEYTEAQLRVIAQLGDLRKRLTKINQQIQTCNKRIVRLSNEKQRLQVRKQTTKDQIQAIANLLRGGS